MTVKKFFKRFELYKELRHIYVSAVNYRKPLSYLYHRFFIGPKIKRLAEPIDRPPTDESYTVHLLTGSRDLTMLLWSLWSWYQAVESSGKLYIHEDGSFAQEDRRLIKKLLPHAVVVDFSWASTQVEAWLAGFPATEHYRQKSVTDKRHVYAVKFLDPYFVSDSKQVLIIDSDLLWFKKPEKLLLGLSGSGGPLMMHGVSQMDFQFRDGSPLSEEVGVANSGIVLFKKADFELGTVEEFTSRIGENANPHFIEQAGYAYVLGKKDLKFLPKVTYHIKGRADSRTVMKHYTGPRREEFWFEGVKALQSKLL